MRDPLLEPIGQLFNDVSTDKQAGHCYGAVYQWLLDSIGLHRQDRQIRLLEIGISLWQPVGSFQAWQTYPGIGLAVGVDIEPYEGLVVAPNKVISGNAYDLEFVESLGSRFPQGFDLIIDDGPHIEEHQVFFLENYLQLCTPGGYLVVEESDARGLLDAAREMSDTLILDFTWNRDFKRDESLSLREMGSRLIIRKRGFS